MEKSMKKLNLLKYSKSFLISTNNYTSIELPQNINNGIVKIYDTLGRLVMKQEVSTDASLINTSNLKSGSYLFVLRTEYGNATKNMIIN